jgi:hypothetical protein
MKCTHCVGLVAAALVAFQGGSALGQSSDTARIIGGMLMPNQVYTIDVRVTLEVVSWSGPGFKALIGPLPGAAPGVVTKFSASQVDDGTGNFDIELVLQGQDGFVYMSGVQPYGGSDGGHSTSDGTTMVVQRITLGGTTYHRFFRLDGPKNVDVTNEEIAGDERPIKKVHQYIEKVSGGTLDPPVFIPKSTEADPKNLRQFITDVIEMAQDAGLPTPDEPLP